METKVVKVTDKNIDEVMEDAGSLIKRGELVAFPTETVYGLGGDALSVDSSAKIYAAKGRPSDNPLIVHVADYSDLEKIVKELPKEAKMLADAFWPGPLTMRFKKNEKVPCTTTGGLDTVAVRMPNNEIALKFIKASGGFIAAPSANRSGRPSPTLAEHVKEDMDGIIPLILDGGQVGIGIESTIVDLSEDEISILRPGYITAEMIEKVIGRKVTLDAAVDGVSKDAHPKAPGMKYRHYAPKAELILVEGEEAHVLNTIIDKASLATVNNPIGLMLKEAHVTYVRERLFKIPKEALIIKSIGDKEAEIAHELYKVLREFDEENVGIIYSESVGNGGLGRAVHNRMIRAAGHNILNT
ncbi:MAG: threonylcarbamoyl-AMP synthase [Lachnospiraceae bacterium]|nr:threonylcarbamoyl-AMP synthase [Lachnospiraceae bacterium]